MAVAAPPSTCDLCGLPARVPFPADFDGQAHVFCCQGCRQVYQILRESGDFAEGQDLTQTPLYRQCLAMGLIAQAPSPPTRTRWTRRARPRSRSAGCGARPARG